MASAPGDYIHFKAHVPLRHVSVGLKQWRYYDYGPKQVPALICLSGVIGTADVFYKQIMFLGMKGYRVIAADAPPVWSHQEWVNTFEKFLDAIDIHHVHLYGTELGGFLAQIFAQYRPRRVKSLVLSNTFLDTRYFADKTPWSSLIHWTPCFILKRHILTGLPKEPQEPFIADSIDFVVNQLETLERDDLASRLILKTCDHSAVPRELKNQLMERYPAAKEAFLKTGGYFPFLSRPDEVNLHLQLHLRRVGVEGRPDLVKGPTRRDSTGNPAKENDPSEDTGDSSNNSESAFRQVEDGSLPSKSVGSADDVGEHLEYCANESADSEMLSMAMPLSEKHGMHIYATLLSGLAMELGKYIMIATALMEVIAHDCSLATCYSSSCVEFYGLGTKTSQFVKRVGLQ